MVKLNTVVIVIFMFIILIPDTILGQEHIKSNATAKIGFRTVHLISLKNIENDVEIATIADDFNKVVAELGYENISYNFWKETEGQEGQFKYIFESNWPDQETFDKVHEYKEFQFVWEKNYDKWKSLVKEDIYTRYILLN